MTSLLRRLDWYVLGFVLILLIFGLVMIYSLTVAASGPALALSQTGFALLGFLLAIPVVLFDYRRLRGWVIPLLLGVVVLLVAVHVAGTTVFGATRWLQIGNFQLQPSELGKLAVVLVAARILSAQFGQARLRHLVVLLILVALPVLLVARQPDLGTAGVLLLTTLFMFLAGRLPKSHWILLGTLVLLGLPVLVANLADYQLERLQTFLTPTRDPYGAGYNVLQSLIAVGNGGLFGQGLGHGTQSQLDFLPVVHTDFIFAGIAESTGLVGSLVLLLVYGALLARTLIVARSAPDTFGYLLVTGVASLWFVQLAINVAMNLGLAPVTGIPLPFVSAGGSALIVNLLAVGLVLSVALRSGRLSGARLSSSRSWNEGYIDGSRGV